MNSSPKRRRMEPHRVRKLIGYNFKQRNPSLSFSQDLYDKMAKNNASITETLKPIKDSLTDQLKKIVIDYTDPS